MEKENLEKIETEMNEKPQDIQSERLEDEFVGSGNQRLFSRIKTKINKRKQKKLEALESQTLTDEENKKVEEKIEEANKEVSIKSSKKKKCWNVIFFILNILLVAGILVWNILSSEDFSPLDLFDLNYGYFVVMLALLLGVLVFDVISVHRMIYRKTLRSRWYLAYKSTAVLRYYDAVTPLSSGGQAFMVTYLTGRGVPASTALSIPIAKLVFQNIAWLIITFICLVVSFVNKWTTLVSAASIIGFVLSFAMVSIIMFVSLSKKAGKNLVVWCLRLLVKMRILKDFDKYYEKVKNFVEDYQNIMREYSHAKLDVIFLIFVHMLRIFCLFSIPFFIYCGFKGWDPSKFGEFFVYTALIDLASSFIPLPGGTGMNELTFTALFNTYLGGATFWGMLFWRFCSYYYYLLQGIVVIAYDTIYGNRKYRWVKTKMALQEESQEFRRLQIENFRQERNKRRKYQKKAQKE